MAELCKHSAVLQHFTVVRSTVMNARQNSLYLFTIQQLNNSCTPSAFKTVHIPVLFQTLAQKYLTVRPSSDVIYGVR